MSRLRRGWALLVALVTLPACGSASAAHPEDGCSGCLCADADWSCDAGTLVDVNGQVLALAPEAGYFRVDSARLFYVFIPADETPADKPLMLLFNGGPGVPATAWLMAMNTAPFTLDPKRTSGAFDANPFSWSRFANLLYVDPRRSGLSYSLGGDDLLAGRMTFDPARDAEDVLEVLVRFAARHPQLDGADLVLVGESYGGTRATLMMERLRHPDPALAPFLSTRPAPSSLVLLQPRLTDHQRTHEDLMWPFPGCLPEAKDWTKCDDPVSSADRCRDEVTRRLLDPDTLAAAIDIDVASIEWLGPHARSGSVRAVDPFSCAPDTSALEARLGPLEPADGYYRMWVDYTNWSEFQSDTQVGATFISQLGDLRVFITDAALDARVWSPALVPALAEYGVAVEHDTAPRSGVQRPGWLVVDGHELRFPHYADSGHDVSAWQPSELADDVDVWLQAPATPDPSAARNSPAPRER